MSDGKKLLLWYIFESSIFWTTERKKEEIAIAPVAFYIYMYLSIQQSDKKNMEILTFYTFISGRWDKMATRTKPQDAPQPVDDQQEARPIAVGWGGKLEEQYQKIKEHAETYPYVWGSYILVYGGFGLWLTYRWRRLRSTEDRVRVLQERLRKLVEAEQPTNSAAVTEQPANSALLTKNQTPPSDDKTTK